MGLSELAQIGEFIGGVAVLITLVYLAIQVRQNTAAMMRTSARQTSLQTSNAVRAQVDYADLISTGFDDLENLTVAERYRFDMVWGMWWLGVEQTFEDERIGLQTSEHTEPYKAIIRGILSTPTGKKWWEERKIWFTASFQVQVEELKLHASEKDRVSISVHMAASNNE